RRDRHGSRRQGHVGARAPAACRRQGRARCRRARRRRSGARRAGAYGRRAGFHRLRARRVMRDRPGATPVGRSKEAPVRHPRPAGTNVVLVLIALGALARPSLAAATCTRSAALDAPTTLVLSGGGVKGAWEAGVAATLVRRGLAPRLVAGSSAGALNAVLLAEGRVDRLDALWRTLRREQVYTLRPSVFFAGLLPGWLTLPALDAAGSVFDPRPLRALVLMSYAPDEQGARPSRLRRALEEAFELAMIHQIRRDTELARLKYPAVDVQLLTPSAPLRVRPLEFDGDTIARLLELGAAD